MPTPSSTEASDQYFGKEFDNLLAACTPHLSEYLRITIGKLKKSAEGETTSRRLALQDEAYIYMAKGVEFAYAKAGIELYKDDLSNYVRTSLVAMQKLHQQTKRKEKILLMWIDIQWYFQWRRLRKSWERI